MKYNVQKHPNGEYRCFRASDGSSIRLNPVIEWLKIDPKSAEPYFDHEFAKKIASKPLRNAE